MKLKTRIHEWLADHISWVQYPYVTLLPQYERRRFRFRDLSGKQQAWIITGLIWLGVILFGLWGSTLKTQVFSAQGYTWPLPAKTRDPSDRSFQRE